MRVRAVVMIHDPSPVWQDWHADWMRSYGMTTAECRIASGLCQGDSLQDIATKAGITVGTARQQLKAIMRKTITSRQAELVALLLHSGG
jgi:DNA-binding CsgD family transcriptional regulator